MDFKEKFSWLKWLANRISSNNVTACRMKVANMLSIEKWFKTIKGYVGKKHCFNKRSKFI